MALSTTALKRDLSRAELALAALAITVLVAVFMQRMRAVEAAAEEAMLVTQLQTMQAQLLSLRLEFVTGGAKARRLTLEDVVQTIAPETIIFANSAADFDWRTTVPGAWVYFRDQQRLDYRVAGEPAALGAVGEPPRVGFQLIASYADMSAGGPRRLVGVRIERLHPAPVTQEP